jgi:hypothetical protein
MKNGSVRKVRRGVQQKFQNVKVPNRKTLNIIMNKLRQRESLLEPNKNAECTSEEKWT